VYAGQGVLQSRVEVWRAKTPNGAGCQSSYAVLSVCFGVRVECLKGMQTDYYVRTGLWLAQFLRFRS